MEEASAHQSLQSGKFATWLKDPSNRAFVGIFIVLLIIRIYYFSLTKTQPLWWDESDYLAYAKNLAGYSTHWIITPQHNSLFPFIVAFFFKLGFSEVLTRFCVEFIPSILILILVYLIGTQLYKDKRIALIAVIIVGTMWELFFNSMRFHLEALGLLFAYLATYVFFVGFERKEKIFWKISAHWAMPLAAVFVALTYATRHGFFMVGLFFIIYALTTRRFSTLVNDRYNWIAAGIGALLIVFFEKLIFISAICEVAETYRHTNTPFNLIPLQVFSSYFTNGSLPLASILLYLFWIGVIIVMINLILHWGYYRRETYMEAKGDLFALLMIGITLGYFLFFQRVESFVEPRWYYPLLLGAAFRIARGTIGIAEFLRPYSKYLPFLFIIIVIGYGGYYELGHADDIIDARIDSYRGIKEAAIYIHSASAPSDVALAIPVPQPEYYAEREFINPVHYFNATPETTTFEMVLNLIRENKDIKYIVVTFSEPNHPSWMQRQLEENGRIVRIEIPFMNTTIDTLTGKQDIKQSQSYEDITFTLATVKYDAIVYEISRL